MAVSEKRQTLDEPYGKLRMLDGFKYKRAKGSDTIGGRIYKDGGLSIEFESGLSEGYAADPKNKGRYIWYREQQINGNKVFLALTTHGAGTTWQAENPRQLPSRRVMIVTFPGRFGPDDAANFYAEVANEEEVAEMLLMVLTFDPTV